MSTTPEGKVKAQIKKLLNKHGAYSHMPVQNGMGAPTLDFVCCVKGLYVAIEAKTRGSKPTPRQQKTMQSIVKAGGIAIWVDEDRLEMLDKLLAKLSQMNIHMEKDNGRPPSA